MRLALVLLLLSTGFAGAAPRCAAEAKERAKALLAFHFGEKPDRFAIDDTVKELAPIKVLNGNGKFDVLESGVTSTRPITGCVSSTRRSRIPAP